MKRSTYQFGYDNDTSLILYTTCTLDPYQWINDRLWLPKYRELEHRGMKRKGKKSKKYRRARADAAFEALIGTNAEALEGSHAIDDATIEEEVPAVDQMRTVEEGPAVTVAVEQGIPEGHVDEASRIAPVAGEQSVVHHGDQSPQIRCGSINNGNIDVGFTAETAGRTLGKSPGTEHGQVSYQMLVSSSHLAQASPVFRKMLKGSFAEAVANSQGLYCITAIGWDPEALVLVLDIMHGHNRSVPQKITLEMMAKVATIVDYYDCLEIVEIFAGIWVDALAESQPSTYGKDTILWLLVSWVFQRQDIFEKMTGLALRYSERLITVEGVPIPHAILKRIDEERQNALAEIFSTLYTLFGTLCKGSECSYECSSMLLGSLMKELSKHGILKPQIKKPYDGYSISSAVNMVNTFTLPIWYSRTGRFGSRYHDSYSSPHTCRISDKMRPTLDKVDKMVPILTLETFRSPAGFGQAAILET
ncbi:hypothetical protein NCS52_01557700 [Fusarium sp. LHS14.1]|nr:hypothetical protein NCS52_01557700 [Fusarium sp. LHS14.1]